MLDDGSTDQTQGIRQAVEGYLHTYFTERDYEKTIGFFHAQISCIGTGKDETAINHEETLRLYARDLAQCPEPIVYAVSWWHITAVTADVGLAVVAMDITGVIQGVPFVVNNLRMTMVLVKGRQQWLIQHMHLSQEQANLEEGEAFPIQEIEAKNQLLEEMIQQRTIELTKALAIIEMAAITDNLTGIYNRRKFDEVLGYEIQRASRFAKPLSIIIGDIDHFKQVNDRYGHLAGDDMLKAVSRLLKNTIRQVDVLARWGGEEFIVLLPETSGGEAVAVAEKLRKVVAESQHELPVPLSMSFGVSEFCASDDADSLLRRADLALYQAKGQGRNRVEMK